MSALTLYCDGLCEPNPNGWACWGWVAFGSDGAVIEQGSGCLGRGAGMTNNVAEYEAALQALVWAYRAGYRTDILVCSDSQLLVNQAMGAWDCSAPTLLPLLARVRKAAALMGLSWRWIPREQNERADALSRQGYRQAAGHEAPIRAKRMKGQQ